MALEGVIDSIDVVTDHKNLEAAGQVPLSLSHHVNPTLKSLVENVPI